MNIHDLPIGPSLGYLFGKFPDLPLKDHFRALKEANSTAAEMVMRGPQRMRIMLEGEERTDQNDLSQIVFYAAIHMESVDIEKNRGPHFFNDCVALLERHRVETFVVHPAGLAGYVYKNLVQRDIPLALENMDGRKQPGRTPEEIRALTRDLPACRFVLDLQHAYENSKRAYGDGIDITLKIAKVMEDLGSIAHLHVSGEFEISGRQILNHAQLHIATNRRTIVEATRQVMLQVGRPLPIILEGQYLLQLSDGSFSLSKTKIEDLFHEAVFDMRRERECLLNELKL
jgi:hypothetical protein